MADEDAKKDFAQWDKDNARTNPLEDFHYTDAFRNDDDNPDEAIKQDKKHMPLRGTGGEIFVNRSSTDNGTKRPLDETTEAPTRKSRRLTGQTDATQQRPSVEAEAPAEESGNPSDDPQQPSNSQDTARPDRRRAGRRTGPAENDNNESRPKVRAQPPIADNQFKGITFGTSAFSIVGPPLKELSKRPALDAGIPDQFVFEKNLADKKLYARPYGDDDVKDWFDNKEAEYKNEDLKWRQLAVYKIIEINGHQLSVPLDLNGKRIDEKHKLKSHIQALKTLIKSYKYEEYSEHDDEDLDQRTQQSNKEHKPPMNRFKKFLNARAAFFAKWNHSKDDDESEKEHNYTKVTVSERKAAMNRRIVIHRGMPFVERDAAENGDDWTTSRYISRKAATQQNVGMTDAESLHSNAAEIRHVAEEQIQVDMLNAENFAAIRKSVRERLRALADRIAAHDLELQQLGGYAKASEAEKKEALLIRRYHQDVKSD